MKEITEGLKALSHKGVISLFGKHFVKTGVFKIWVNLSTMLTI